MSANAAEQIDILTPREVPLGGPRAMKVRRTLPSRGRSLIGAWCFVDHYGPDDVAQDRPGMVVAPHPHIGLQTVSWLFAGAIEHRDSIGSHAVVRPGELNLMTAGFGISHSEVSTPETTVLHGVQLWVALPKGRAQMNPDFARYAARPVPVAGGQINVFLGELSWLDEDAATHTQSSPVPTQTPLLGAQIDLDAGASLRLTSDAVFEHGVLVDSGSVTVNGQVVQAGELAFLPAGPDSLVIDTPEKTRILVLGGPPFGEEIIMWWNFVGRSQSEIEQARARWEEESNGFVPQRFGRVVGDMERIPAPALPGINLKPRR
ncbi:pirin family protein [Ornithinimicrobium sp. Arc0846-15]|nr:pirin family protein [Ornithinimicrobium laminariae]